MKRLILLLLFLTGRLLLPLQQNKVLHCPADSGTSRSFALPSSSSSLSAGTHFNVAASRVKPWKELFKRRPVGLNDGHEQALAVYSIDIRALFVYIHTRYHTYAQTFRNVAINLVDGRGPPKNV